MSTTRYAQRLTQNPFRLLIRALVLWVTGCIRFERKLAGITLDDHGERFTAFRKIVIEKENLEPARPTVMFVVRFRFKNLSSSANRRLSLIPIPFIAAQPGLRSKTWLLGERSGDFMGYYEFDTRADAEAYWSSLPLRMMRRRAEVGSLSYEICDDSTNALMTLSILRSITNETGSIRSRPPMSLERKSSL